jgi:hypothetical protein
MEVEAAYPFQYSYIYSSVSVSALNRLEPNTIAYGSQLLQLTKLAVSRTHYYQTQTVRIERAVYCATGASANRLIKSVGRVLRNTAG